MNTKIGRNQFLALLSGKVTAKERARIEDAYTLAKYGHRNQLRDQGTRYFEHPKSVALIVIKELGVYTPKVIIMALLHDIVEDSFILSRDGLRRLFGQRVICGLDVLTNKGDKSIYYQGLRTTADLGAIIVKFADRLHNLRTINGVREEKKAKKMLETRTHYLPIIYEKIKSSRGGNRKALIYLAREIQEILED